MTEVDKAVNELAKTLSNSSSEAMKEIKQIFWKEAEDWDQLLKERAAISGRLILSAESKAFIQQFKSSKK
jgi:methylglutaconyl-CoA hydratase